MKTNLKALALAVCGTILVLAGYLCRSRTMPAGAPPQEIPAPPPPPDLSSPRLAPGSALGEAPIEKPAYSNEDMNRLWETQKIRMGIKRLLPPLAASAPASADADRLNAPPAPARVPGQTPALLSAAEPVKPRNPDPGRPLRAGESEIGTVAYSMEELTRIWREHALPPPMPRADFSRQMLIVLFGPNRISGSDQNAGRIQVRFHAAPGIAAGDWLILPRSDLAVAFLPDGTEAAHR